MEAVNIPGVTPKDGIVQMVVEIDKDLASLWLERNVKNPRKINHRIVHAYAADMSAGRWLLNGEPIIFDRNGNLNNGQHRLTAVCEANAKIKSVVIWGVDPDCTLYDYGMKRKISQEMQIPNVVEAAAGVIVNNADGNFSPKGMIRSYIQEHYDELYRAYIISRTGSNHSICRKRDVVTATYLILRSGVASEDELQDFFTVANSGFPIEGRENTPAIVLARYIREKKSFGAMSNMRRNAEFVLRAFMDFHYNKRRMLGYTINDTKTFDHMLSSVRKTDGLEC